MMFLAQCPEDLIPIINIIDKVILYIRIFIPILLIIFGSIDLGKAIMAGEEKEIKAATQLLIKKLIAAAAVFLLTILITLVLGIVNVGDKGVKWSDCINQSNNFDNSIELL